MAAMNELLPIIVLDGNNGWDEVQENCPEHLDDRGKERLMAVFNKPPRCVAIEYHYIDKDYRDTFSCFHSKRFTTPSSRCVRLHFFNRPIEHYEIEESVSLAEAYLGYSIIRPTRPNCIGRMLIDVKYYSGKGAYVCTCREKVHLFGTVLEIEGFPFISQDADATVCAQSALWMLVRYFSNRYPVYPESYPSQISNLVQDYAFGGRLAPADGLYTWQLAETLRRLRFSPVTYSKDGFGEEAFNRIMYTYLESGIPLLATIGNHVIVLNGHISDFTTLNSLKENAFTSVFATGVTINDDNGAPYELLMSNECRHPYLKFCAIKEIIAPLAEKIFLTAENFEKVVSLVLKDSETGLEKHSPMLYDKTLILRVYLTTVKSYKKKLNERGMGHDKVKKNYLLLPMPHFIWVCEISSPNEYAKEQIWGEIIWDATRNAYEETVGWIAIHYPEKLMLDAGSALNGRPEILETPLTNSLSYSLYRSNLREI